MMVGKRFIFTSFIFICLRHNIGSRSRDCFKITVTNCGPPDQGHIVGSCIMIFFPKAICISKMRIFTAKLLCFLIHFIYKGINAP